MKRFIALALVVAGALWSQSATPIVYPPGPVNPTWLMEPQAMPTSPTVILTGSVVVLGGWVMCTTARTVTITDGNAVGAMTAIPVAANQIVSLLVLQGAYIPTSLSISASGSGCNYSIWGRR